VYNINHINQQSKSTKACLISGVALGFTIRRGIYTSKSTGDKAISKKKGIKYVIYY